MPTSLQPRTVLLAAAVLGLIIGLVVAFSDGDPSQPFIPFSDDSDAAAAEDARVTPAPSRSARGCRWRR